MDHTGPDLGTFVLRAWTQMGKRSQGGGCTDRKINGNSKRGHHHGGDDSV